MRNRLALLSIVALATGILLGSTIPTFVPFFPFALFIGVIFILAWFFGRRDVYLYPALLLLFLTLGGLRVAVVPLHPPAAFLPLIDTNVNLTGTIVADPDLRETNQRLTIEVQKEGARMKLTAVADRYTSYSYGDQVLVSGPLTLPEAFDTDGGRSFAYDKFLAKDGIFTVMQHASVHVSGSANDPLTTIARFLLTGKHAFATALEDALPEPHASLAEGLLVGGKQGLGQDLLDDFTVSGLLPIVVLSGYNVMIVAEGLLALLAFLPRRFALTVAGLSIVAFVFIGGAGSSAVRAGFMACLGLFGKMAGRRYDALRALLVVFVLMLLVTPLSLAYDPGFDFSFLATLGLIVLSPLIATRTLHRINHGFIREMLATTLAAQIFVLPLLLYETGNLSLVALPANVLVLPAVPFAMAFSAVAGGIALVVPAVATYVGLPAYALLAYIIGVATTAAGLPFAHMIIPAFPFVLTLPFYVLIWWLCVRLEKDPRQAASPRRRISA